MQKYNHFHTVYKLFTTTLLCTFILLGATQKSQGQNCNVVNDTVYYFTVHVDNEVEGYTHCLLKNIEDCPATTTSLREFICELYTQALYIKEIETRFNGFHPCEFDSIRQAPQKYRELRWHFLGKLVELNSQGCTFTDLSIGNATVSIYVVKFIGDFWKMALPDKLIDITHSITVPRECFGTEYYYEFVDIKQVSPLSEGEKEQLRRVLQNAIAKD